MRSMLQCMSGPASLLGEQVAVSNPDLYLSDRWGNPEGCAVTTQRNIPITASLERQGFWVTLGSPLLLKLEYDMGSIMIRKTRLQLSDI